MRLILVCTAHHFFVNQSTQTVNQCHSFCTDNSLAREKYRFEKELSEQKAYGERMKDELERIIRENKQLQQELDDAQEK